MCSSVLANSCALLRLRNRGPFLANHFRLFHIIPTILKNIKQICSSPSLYCSNLAIIAQLFALIVFQFLHLSLHHMKFKKGGQITVAVAVPMCAVTVATKLQTSTRTKSHAFTLYFHAPGVHSVCTKSHAEMNAHWPHSLDEAKKLMSPAQIAPLSR